MASIIQAIKDKWKEVKEEKLTILDVVIRESRFDIQTETQRMKSARSKEGNT